MQLAEECWVLTTGEAGMRSQALGLAAATGLPVKEKRVAVAGFWNWLPGGLLPMPFAALSRSSDSLDPPWPALVIGCGRRSIGPALAVKRQSRGQTIAAYVQNPEFARQKFDLVVALPHDALSGANVVTIPTALHGVDAMRLNAAAAEWRPRLKPESRPLLGVLVGGDNGPYRLEQAALERLVAIVGDAQGRGFRSFLTPSRRTGPAATRFLADALASVDGARMWDGSGDNPYLGILGLADRIVVTGDSISMISEALATGRAVHVLPLEGRGRRHDAFLGRIVADGLVSLIAGAELDWAFAGHSPIYSNVEPGRRLRALLAERANEWQRRQGS